MYSCVPHFNEVGAYACQAAGNLYVVAELVLLSASLFVLLLAAEQLCWGAMTRRSRLQARGLA